LTVVDNGKAAVDKAREIDPDILLIDALMPGMTGYEVAEMVRSTPSLAAKPILILTGSFEPFDEEKAKRCGADDFIAKPFESQQIISKVKELLELGRSRTLSAQVSPSQPAPETVREQVSEASAPIFESPAPVSIQQAEAAQPADDIWGAFTPEAEPPFEAVAAPVVAAPSSAPVEPDVFAIVTEESDAQLVQSATSPDTSPQHTGSQWIPVEENTFEFEEDVIAEPPQTAFAAQAAPAQEVPFGGISFEDDVTPPRPPVFSAAPEPESAVAAPAFADFTPLSGTAEASPAPESVLAAEMAPPAAITPSVSLTEEQLRAAILGASREVIERIVWEVVPDLAEVLIRDAIRKIKEGA
jgi:CheY-like chemotaxis protein